MVDRNTRFLRSVIFPCVTWQPAIVPMRDARKVWRTSAMPSAIAAEQQSYRATLTTVATAIGADNPHRAAEELARAAASLRGWEAEHLQAVVDGAFGRVAWSGSSYGIEVARDGRPPFPNMHAPLRTVPNSTELIPHVSKHGEHYYNFWRDATHVRGIWRRTTLAQFQLPEPAWDTVIDLDQLAAAPRVVAP